MNIAIDVLHISYWNFYKNIIGILESQNHQVFIFVRERGPLLKVIEREYTDKKNIVVTGKYYRGRKKLFLHLLRIPKLLYYLIKFRIEVVSSDGFFIAVAAKILNTPAIMHSDDFEYKFSYKMTQLFSTKMIIPDVFPITSKKDFHYKGCKEYAYLNKKYLNDNTKEPKKADSFRNNYVFVRLISKSSLNYLSNNCIDKLIDTIFSYLHKNNINVLVLSEENFITRYSNCEILTPPIKNFHTLLSGSSIVITEGDTMAREAVLLGSPVIYMGGRKMKIHDYFRGSENFLETDNMNRIIDFIDHHLSSPHKNNKSDYDFEDICQIMASYITNPVK